MRRRPYATFAFAYTLMFVYAFAAIANFGILSRQRTQVLPFVFVLLALPAVEQMTERNAAAAPGLPR